MKALNTTNPPGTATIKTIPNIFMKAAMCVIPASVLTTFAVRVPGFATASASTNVDCCVDCDIHVPVIPAIGATAFRFAGARNPSPGMVKNR